MNYSIGEVSRMFDLPASTLRYYDKEGLLPHIQRQGTGIRRFDQQTIEALRVIECLKKSGMEMARLEKTLAMIDFKCWYYSQAVATGSEDFTAAIPEGLPEEVRKLYDVSHT